MTVMTLEEIRGGIIRLLRENVDVENITGEEVTQSGGKPLLHVQLEPLSYGTAAAGSHTDKEILVDIAYMVQLVTSNREIYGMLEQLDGIFRPFFRIGDRAFTCDGQMDITDDIGHYMFTLRFTDAGKEETGPAAEELRVEWR